jgi:hypothetical protein
MPNTTEAQDRANRYRFMAIYHNCKGSAAFARRSAEMTDDPVQKMDFMSEAYAYDRCAGWIKRGLDEWATKGDA